AEQPRRGEADGARAVRRPRREQAALLLRAPRRLHLQAVALVPVEDVEQPDALEAVEVTEPVDVRLVDLDGALDALLDLRLAGRVAAVEQRRLGDGDLGDGEAAHGGARIASPRGRRFAWYRAGREP